MIIIGSRAVGVHQMMDFNVDRAMHIDACASTCAYAGSDIDVICSESEVPIISAAAVFVREQATRGSTHKLIAESTRDRVVNHIDKYWSSKDDHMYELEIASDGTHTKILHDLILSDPDTVKFGACKHHGVDMYVPSMNVLYMIKMSHRFLRNSPHFLKTVQDIEYMRDRKCKIPARYFGVYLLRQKAQYNYKHPSLNMSKNAFFSGDNVKYVYDHDDIHKVMALYDAPAYTYFKKDGAEVAVDRNKFERLPKHLKVASVIEESLVLALERSQIPFKDIDPPPKVSYLKALEKVCTSITSGWWREFAWEHYRNAEEYIQHNRNYADRFWQAVKDGKVRQHKNAV